MKINSFLKILRNTGGRRVAAKGLGTEVLKRRTENGLARSRGEGMFLTLGYLKVVTPIYKGF